MDLNQTLTFGIEHDGNQLLPLVVVNLAALPSVHDNLNVQFVPLTFAQRVTDTTSHQILTTTNFEDHDNAFMNAQIRTAIEAFFGRVFPFQAGGRLPAWYEGGQEAGAAAGLQMIEGGPLPPNDAVVVAANDVAGMVPANAAGGGGPGVAAEGGGGEADAEDLDELERLFLRPFFPPPDVLELHDDDITGEGSSDN
ncbi:hypothetical protein OROMI_018439 [Orobanche minor]